MSNPVTNSPLVAQIPPTTALYQAGTDPNPDIWDRPLVRKIVPDEEVAAHLADGWYRHPDDVPAEGADKPTRGRKAASE